MTKKAMLNTFRNACILTTITGLTALSARAADSTTTTATPNGASAYETTGRSAPADHTAKGFIKEAYRDNQMEIDMAGVGVTKAQNPDLKAFCQQLQEDHTKANQELQPIAQKYGVTENASMREREVNKFEKETAGADFDKKFATEMIKDHQKAIKKFERAASKLQEADVKQYAENMLPKLREHLQKAETVAAAVGVDQSTISSLRRNSSSVGGTTEEENTQTGTGTSGKTPGLTSQGAAGQQLQPDAATTPKR
jgi:putative membrane protein